MGQLRHHVVNQISPISHQLHEGWLLCKLKKIANWVFKHETPQLVEALFVPDLVEVGVPDQLNYVWSSLLVERMG